VITNAFSILIWRVAAGVLLDLHGSGDPADSRKGVIHLQVEESVARDQGGALWQRPLAAVAPRRIEPEAWATLGLCGVR